MRNEVRPSFPRQLVVAQEAVTEVRQQALHRLVLQAEALPGEPVQVGRVGGDVELLRFGPVEFRLYIQPDR
ncbi:hypothetical protein GCM10017687_04610 [Streptomyces echinatus]